LTSSAAGFQDEQPANSSSGKTAQINRMGALHGRRKQQRGNDQNALSIASDAASLKHRYAYQRINRPCA
jgi:hypothetical protein